MPDFSSEMQEKSVFRRSVAKKDTEKGLVTEALLWLALPTLLFLAFWLRVWLAIILCSALVAAVAVRLSEGAVNFHTSGFRPVRRDSRYYTVFFILLLLLLLSGIGALTAQIAGDHVYRNAVFYDLVRRPWPVVYPDGDEGPVTLCYYFGFWLPAALIGKLTGRILPGDVAQFAYALWGMWIFFRFLFSRFGGRASWVAFLAPLAFGAADLLIGGIADLLLPFQQRWELLILKDLATEYYSLPPLGVLVVYVYNQGVASLVACILLWHERRRPRALLLLYSLMLIQAPYPAMGIFVAMAWRVLRDFKAFLTWENLAGIIIAAVIGLFFIGNKSHDAAAPVAESLTTMAMVLLIFLPLSYGLWLLALWPLLKRNSIFWLTAVPALIVPLLLSSPHHQDIGYRITIPSMLVIIVAEIMALRHWRYLPRMRKGLLAIAILLGAYTPGQVLVQTVDRNIDWLRGEAERKSIYIMGRLEKGKYNDCRSNFVIDGETFFTRYLMRQVPREDSSVSPREVVG